MNEDRKFKTRLFGYSKKNVNDFIIHFNMETQKRLDEKDDIIEDLKKENAELSKKLDALEQEKIFVGDAFLKAEKKADEIIQEAVKEGLAKKAQVENEIKQSAAVLKKINEEIRQLRNNVISSVNKYQSELDDLIKITDEESKDI